MFGALDPASLKEFGREGVLRSIKGLQKGGFGDVDAQGAFNIFDAVGLQDALALENLGAASSASSTQPALGPPGLATPCLTSYLRAFRFYWPCTCRWRLRAWGGSSG